MRPGFPSDTVVDVQQIDDKFWKVLKEIEYKGLRDHFKIPVDQKTDFASVPRIFVWFLPRYGRYTKAAILHDYLWQIEVPQNGMSRLDADGLFRQAMRELKVPFLRRWLMWTAVRLAALFKPDGRKGWLKELPRVALFTILGFIIVFPPIIPILLSIVIFHLMEWIVWVLLKCVNVGREKTHRKPRKVNEPSFTWNL